MATTINASPAVARSRTQAGYPEGGVRFDFTVAVLSALFLAGLWVDGWAHFHGQTDDSFFTPWHFLFYGSFGIVALFLGFTQLRNANNGYAFTRALPKGYWLSLIGVVTFTIGGAGDMIWHTLFGIEGGTEALLSPTHLVLGMGMTLVFTGPVRAALNRARQLSDSEGARGWRNLAPLLIGVTLVLSLFMFFTSYANPLALPLAAEGVFVTEATYPVEQLYLMNADGTLQTRLTAETESGSSWGAWSPDGERIAFSRGVGRGAQLNANEVFESDVYVMNADGTNVEQVTDAPGEEYGAAWSPDAIQLVYVSVFEDDYDLYTIDAAGGEPTRLTQNAGKEWAPSWSPDGTRIAFSMEDTSQNIWTINADGSNPVQLTSEAENWSPRWSPDGTRILFNSNVNGDMGIYTMNADGSDPRLVFNGDAYEAYASWSPEGRNIVFSAFNGKGGALYTIAANAEAAGEPVNISNNDALLTRLASYSPNGDRILFSGSAPPVEEQVGGLVQDFGVTSILLTAALLTGTVLILAWRWTLPFGAFTLLLTVSTLLMTLLIDSFYFIPGALITGLVADVLYRTVKPSASNISGLRLFAFVVPVLYMALYFIAVQVLANIGWSIHVWTGAIFLAGVVGLLLVTLLDSTTRERVVAS